MDIGNRIRLLRESLGLSQDELAKQIGYKSRSSINKIELGHYNLTQSKIKRLADALGTTPAYIMGWDEPAPPADVAPVQDEDPLPCGLSPLSPAKAFPLLNNTAGEIPPTAANGSNLRLPVDIAADYCLRCPDDSMTEARIHHGDIVFIRQQSVVESGDIAAVLIDGELLLRRIYRTDNLLTLTAANATYAPLVCTGAQCSAVHILGKAVYFLSTAK